MSIFGLGSLILYGEEEYTFVKGLHFAVVTITTIGYGDQIPETTKEKIATIIYIYTGVLFGSVGLGLFINSFLYSKDRRSMLSSWRILARVNYIYIYVYTKLINY